MACRQTNEVATTCDFYTRQQNASRVLAIVYRSLSVRPSVRPSVCHTRDLYTVEPIKKCKLGLRNLHCWLPLEL